MKVMLVDTKEDPVRLAFLHVFTKRDGFKNADGTVSEPKFEATPILKPGGANAIKVQDAIAEVCKDKYGEKLSPVFDKDGDPVLGDDGKPLHLPAWQAIYKGFEDDQKGLRKGNLKRNGNDVYDGFADMVYVNPKNTTRPGLFDTDATPLVQEDGKPYSGCYGNVEIDIWALNKPNVKKRVVIDLLGIQFTRDGDAFGGSSAPSKADSFAALSVAKEPAAKSSVFDD